ncbi:Hypothetical protein CINCED_3A001995 [Cinara cedri]|uniref:Uncharacterized protein n=1 Tax=Cinara cedri TaxID=506608 RepID=A0A5E4N8M1_9HEMI|nr:Hypothetical protein CINCED_3A001995 [Cinara cedri]
MSRCSGWSFSFSRLIEADGKCMNNALSDKKGRYSKCPNYKNAVFINANLRPSVFLGLSGTTKFNINRTFGTNFLVGYLIHRTTISSIHPCGNRFRFGFTSTKANNNAIEKSSNGGDGGGDVGKVHLKPTLCWYLDTDLKRNTSHKLRFNVFDKLWMKINGQILADWSKSKVVGLVEWADDEFNVQISINKTTDQLNELKMNFIRQMPGFWVLGGQCTFVAQREPPFSLLPKILKGYEGMLGYQQSCMTYVATLDQSLSTALRVMARINSNVTTCVEVKYDLRKNKAKSTLSHRIVLSDEIEAKVNINEMEFEIDTGATVMVIGKLDYQNYFENIKLETTSLSLIVELY